MAYCLLTPAQKRRLSHAVKHNMAKKQPNGDSNGPKQHTRELLAELEDGENFTLNPYCEGCYQLLSNCICLEAQYEPEFWDEYRCMSQLHISNRNFPQTYNQYLKMRHLYDNQVGPTDWFDEPALDAVNPFGDEPEQSPFGPADGSFVRYALEY